MGVGRWCTDCSTFEFTLRISRVYLSDIIGKRADLRVSDRVFGHALRIKNKDRSKSTGSFISQIRELEGVRELVTSTTISAIADFPFFFLFLIIFAIIETVLGDAAGCTAYAFAGYSGTEEVSATRARGHERIFNP